MPTSPDDDSIFPPDPEDEADEQFQPLDVDADEPHPLASLLSLRKPGTDTPPLPRHLLNLPLRSIAPAWARASGAIARLDEAIRRSQSWRPWLTGVLIEEALAAIRQEGLATSYERLALAGLDALEGGQDPGTRRALAVLRAFEGAAAMGVSRVLTPKLLLEIDGRRRRALPTQRMLETSRALNERLGEDILVYDEADIPLPRIEAWLTEWEKDLAATRQAVGGMPPLLAVALALGRWLQLEPSAHASTTMGAVLLPQLAARAGLTHRPLLFVVAHLNDVWVDEPIEQWLPALLTAFAEAAEDGLLRLKAIEQDRHLVREMLTLRRRRNVDVALSVYDLARATPLITSKLVAKRLDMTVQGALKFIRELEAGGFLHETTGRQTWQLWRAIPKVAQKDVE